MKIKLKQRYLKIILIALGIALIFNLASAKMFNSSEIQAIGDLNVNWGVPDGAPIFTITNAIPGDIVTRTILVTNNASTFRPVGVKGIEQGGDTLKAILQIEINVDGTPVYGAGETKTVEQFFTESAGPDGIFLTNINPSQSKTINFIVTFPQSADNTYQNKSTIFDLVIGISIDLPDECGLLNLDPTPIIGSKKAETLTGTSGNDLIMGLEGADKINGNGGDDCILGGTGADRINGNEGNDAIFGQDGGDTINGNNGDDYISGGVGGDTIKGENGEDHLIGSEHADNIDGGNDNDILEGGDAADTLKGGNGDDNLDGGPGRDIANGNNGTDICNAETETNCEL